MNPSQNNADLSRNRSVLVAKSFYRQLKAEGFSNEQIIQLSTNLLDLIAEDMQGEPRATNAA